MINTTRLTTLFGIEGKTAIVTGAGQGIGRGIALLLADAGANVVVADLNGPNAATTAAAINDAGGTAKASIVDVADIASIDALANFTESEFGGIDILVNNAGIFPKRPYLDVDQELWDQVHTVNLRGVFFCMQAAIRSMKAKARGGRIVNISSVASRNATVFNQPHYNATKAGVSSLTRAAAIEFAPDNILINGILPGGVGTEGAAVFSSSGIVPKGPITGLGRIALGRIATPDEIAAAVLYLVSPASAYVTGHEIVVDGGFLVS